MLIISTSYQTNLTQNGYHLLPSAVVSYKQVSNIWTYFSLTHILLRSPKDISCSCRFSPLFQVVFLLIFYILIPEDFDLRIKKIDFFQSWVRFFSYFNISHSLRWIDPIQVCWTTLPYHAETHLTVTSPYNLAWTAFKFRNIEII